MKRFISLSGGVESTTCCILYGKGATAIWCDPGDEHAPMYERMDKLESSLKDLHGGDFELIRIIPSVTVKGKTVSKISEYVEEAMFMPSIMKRWCTGRFKITPIDKFLSKQGECELIIGLNADEEPGEDRTGNFMKCKNVTYRYPLYEDGHSREDCEEILNLHGLHPNFPLYMSRGGCKHCFFKREAEYKCMYFFAREEFEEVRSLENKTQDKRKKHFSIMPSGKSMNALAVECEQELSNWGIEQIERMYRKVQATQSCGAFCHR